MERGAASIIPHSVLWEMHVGNGRVMVTGIVFLAPETQAKREAGGGGGGRGEGGMQRSGPRLHMLGTRFCTGEEYMEGSWVLGCWSAVGVVIGVMGGGEVCWLAGY